MDQEATYTYTRLSASSAARLATAHYQLVGPLRSKFYVPGLHDNYLIENAAGRYILRVYRNDWRSPEEVYFELELLAYLGDNNAQVAAPVRTVAGGLSFRIESPEGERIAALFHYANGRAPEDGMLIDQCVLLGRAVSNTHCIADAFITHHARPELDAQYLVDESIAAITPFLGTTDKSYIEGLHARLRQNWPRLPKEAGIFGICIGDINASNFHIDHNRQITLFDFDQCGYGFRAFEIGKFISSLKSHRMKRALVDAFLDGYQQGRCLSPAELEAVPYFQLVAVIWVMAIHAKNANLIGYKRLEKPYWDSRIAILKELESQADTLPDVGDATRPFRG